MPNSWLNRGFFNPHYGDERVSEQIFIILFREGMTLGISWPGCMQGAIGA
ncbi:MAG: hypothetical protein LM600_04220 [Thaumarchaeota archaeon]|nr:hypothetical protein [Nitrososphaerota archaeon]